MNFDIRNMLDPVPIARHEGRRVGQREMRDRVCQEIASFAAISEQSVAQELWALVRHIERLEMP